MEIKITARHGSLADATKAKITEKISKLEKFLERMVKAEVIVDLEKPLPKVDLILVTEMKKEFNSSVENLELFAAIDQLLDKIQQQIKKFKEIRGENRPSGKPAKEDWEGAKSE